MIMIHGRGSSGADFITFAPELEVDDFAVIAPNAPGRTWYPFSFMAPAADNAPHLENSLKIIGDIVDMGVENGVAHSDIYFLGFSQGACLTLEYAARNARRYGGVVAFTGGLIGAVLDPKKYAGNFDGTPIYLGTGNPDPHVPEERVQESASVLREMGGHVLVDVFTGMGHTIILEEIERANDIFGGKGRPAK